MHSPIDRDARAAKRLSSLWFSRSLTRTFGRRSRFEQGVFVARLAGRLLVMAARGSPLWFLNVVRLALFAVACAPALLRCAYFWWTEVEINVPYGPGLRHLCDVYRARGRGGAGGGGGGGGAPVVVFVAGGAWVIGYKAWGVPLGRALSLHGICVVAPDYRNCPQCGVGGMVDDLDRALAWTREHVRDYGGDPRNVVLVGQSAGAHLCALLLLKKAAAGTPALARTLRGFVGVSGPYHVPATAAHWRAKGFGRGLLDFIFGDERGMGDASPTVIAAGLARAGPARAAAAAAALPPIRLIHGTADASAPPIAAELLEARLALLGADVAPTALYAHWTHTDPILERPFAGDQRLHADLHAAVAEWVASDLPRFDADHPDLRRLCPQVFIDLGRWCMPF